ncbi:MAG: hypothetical protein ABI399_04095 [Bauldia sp.]
MFIAMNRFRVTRGHAWTNSDTFRRAHAGADGVSDIHIGHPALEGFEALADTRVIPTEAEV